VLTLRPLLATQVCGICSLILRLVSCLLLYPATSLLDWVLGIAALSHVSCCTCALVSHASCFTRVSLEQRLLSCREHSSSLDESKAFGRAGAACLNHSRVRGNQRLALRLGKIGAWLLLDEIALPGACLLLNHLARLPLHCNGAACLLLNHLARLPSLHLAVCFLLHGMSHNSNSAHLGRCFLTGALTVCALAHSSLLRPPEWPLTASRK
jgi:hypothetical protein